MKPTKIYFVILFFLATVVPTELLHYVHVVGDLTEHYEHHQNLSLTDFLSHALNEKGTDKSHPEHNHSPFNKHHSVCANTFISVLPEPGKLVLESNLVTNDSRLKIRSTSNDALKDVLLSIWQPPKING